MARDLAAEARLTAMACDGISCSKTAESLRALAAEFEQLQACRGVLRHHADDQENLSTVNGG